MPAGGGRGEATVLRSDQRPREEDPHSSFPIGGECQRFTSAAAQVNWPNACHTSPTRSTPAFHTSVSPPPLLR